MKPRHVIGVIAIVAGTVVVVLYWKFIMFAGILAVGIFANAYARKIAPHTSSIFFENRPRNSGSGSIWSKPSSIGWSSASTPTGGRRSSSVPSARPASNIENYFDANGNPIGTSMANGMGGSDYYSRSGKYLGQTNHSGTFDAQGNPVTSGQKLGDLLFSQEE